MRSVSGSHFIPQFGAQSSKPSGNAGESADGPEHSGAEVIDNFPHGRFDDDTAYTIDPEFARRVHERFYATVQAGLASLGEPPSGDETIWTSPEQ